MVDPSSKRFRQAMSNYETMTNGKWKTENERITHLSEFTRPSNNKATIVTSVTIVAFQALIPLPD